MKKLNENFEKRFWGESSIKKRFNLRAFINIMLLAIFTVSAALAQNGAGKVVGKVVDSESGEGLIGVNVYFDGSTLGAATDVDGTFFIENVPAGNYTLIVQMISYGTLRVTDVKIEAGKVRKMELILKPEALTTDEVVVEAKMVQDNEASLLKMRQKSLSVSDAISAEAISRSGSSDAADAMKKVTGASVVDGKYVYIRGLGERYSSTQLNGAELPSSDPGKKAFQFDLLPSNFLDNIVTIKSFTPDKPGNFSGGIVDISTKTFPEDLTIKLNTSSAYSSNASLNNNFLTYHGGAKDWLGYDDGIRSIPSTLTDLNIHIWDEGEARWDEQKAQELDRVSKSFNSVMSVARKSVPVNQNYAFSIGNRINVGSTSSVGYLASMTYGHSFNYYDDGQVGRYTLNKGSITSLNPQLLLNDAKGTEEANWGGLATFSFNFNPAHEIGGNVFYSRSGIATTRYQEGSWPQEFSDENTVYVNRVLGYKERELRSYQLNGKHHFSSIFNLSMDWTAAFAKTLQNEPDLRLITDIEFRRPSGTQYSIVSSNFDNPSRYYRNLVDNGNTYNLNFSLPFNQWSNLGSKFKFGGSYQKKDRVFTERIFSYRADNQLFNQLNGNVEKFFSPENSGIKGIGKDRFGREFYEFGNLIYDNSKARNNYGGNQDIQAIYGMVELPLSRDLRFIGGLRYETTDLNMESDDFSLENGQINENDLLHSVNLIYAMKDNMNLRTAVTRTLARPNFREIAPFSAKEFVNDVEVKGNPELQRTLIDNYDLRWEYFLRPGEILAVSGFYKNLSNPIEFAYAFNSTKSNPIITYTNVNKAKLYGLELEARMSLEHFYTKFRNFSFGSNLSLVHSRVDIAGEELAARQGIDPNVKTTRVLQGQSNYVLNVDFSYTNPKWGTTAGLNFNTFGERLSKVSANITPDVYEQPQSMLDFIVSQKIYRRFGLKFAAKNLLNSKYKESYRFEGRDYIFLQYRTGRLFSVGASYSM